MVAATSFPKVSLGSGTPFSPLCPPLFSSLVCRQRSHSHGSLSDLRQKCFMLPWTLCEFRTLWLSNGRGNNIMHAARLQSTLCVDQCRSSYLPSGLVASPPVGGFASLFAPGEDIVGGHSKAGRQTAGSGDRSSSTLLRTAFTTWNYFPLTVSPPAAPHRQHRPKSRIALKACY